MKERKLLNKYYEKFTAYEFKEHEFPDGKSSSLMPSNINRCSSRHIITKLEAPKPPRDYKNRS